MRNYEIAADNTDIVRCKNCINNPARKGISKHMCPLNQLVDVFRDDEIVTVDGEDYYYSETVNDNLEDPYGDWFCANGEK